MNYRLNEYFQELLSLRKVYSEKDYESGRAHITANYTQSVLPGDNRLYISVQYKWIKSLKILTKKLFWKYAT